MNVAVSVEERIAVIEEDLAKVKKDIHVAKNEAMKTDKRLTDVEADLKTVKNNTVEILSFVDGGKKVFGFAKKHWKTGLTFGAGLMTAAGIGNPKILTFISTYFGIAT